MTLLPWLQLQLQLVKMPCGISVVSPWVSVVSSWYPRGILVVSSWCPRGVLVVSSWYPRGILVVSSWDRYVYPCGVHMGSLMNLKKCHLCKYLVRVWLPHNCLTFGCALSNDDLVRDMRRCPLLPPPLSEEIDLTSDLQVISRALFLEDAE
ncbi:hypothetical protein ES708_33495 [subsurface metagenome]